VCPDQEVAVADDPAKKTAKAAAKTTAPKKAAAKKTTAKKAVAKKTAAKKVPAAKTVAKKTAAAKTAAKKAPAAKKTAAKTAPAEAPAPETPAVEQPPPVLRSEPRSPSAPPHHTPLEAVLGDARALGRLASAYRSGRYRDISPKRLALVAAGLAYVASPLDVVPDFVPGGFLDDALVLALVLRTVKTEIDAFRRWEQQQP
jgi:uncharacterized membrane protein YkvA (DUF1232 family)